VALVIDLACQTRRFGYFRSEDPMEAVQFVVFDAAAALWESVRERRGFGQFAAAAAVQFNLWGFRTRPLGLTWVLGCSFVFVDEAAEDGPALDPFLGKAGECVIGPGRAELAAAVGTTSVLMGLVLGQDRRQVPFAGDEHPVGDLCPGRERGSFRMSVRAGAAGRDLDGLDPGSGQGRAGRVGELPGPGHGLERLAP